MFATLRKLPILGRPFSPEDDKPGADRSRSWEKGSGSAASAEIRRCWARRLRLSGESFTVIGVIPKELHGSWKTNRRVHGRSCAWRTASAARATAGTTRASNVIGRLRPEVTVERARSDVVSLAKRLAEEHPQSSARQSMTLVPLLDSFVAPCVRPCGSSRARSPSCC